MSDGVKDRQLSLLFCRIGKLKRNRITKSVYCRNWNGIFSFNFLFLLFFNVCHYGIKVLSFEFCCDFRNKRV